MADVRTVLTSSRSMPSMKYGSLNLILNGTCPVIAQRRVGYIPLTSTSATVLPPMAHLRRSLSLFMLVHGPKNLPPLVSSFLLNERVARHILRSPRVNGSLFQSSQSAMVRLSKASLVTFLPFASLADDLVA